MRLPAVTLRFGGNLILNPLDLTYVIENKVLMIIAKAEAKNVTREKDIEIGASQKGMLAYSQNGGVLVMSGGMGGMSGGRMDGMSVEDSFGIASVQRYRTYQETLKTSTTYGNSGDYGGGDGDGAVTRSSGKKREYAAIRGPLVHASTDLGVAFISLPGDFQSIPVPTRVDATRFQPVLVEGDWRGVTELQPNDRRFVLEESPVVDDRGEPVGMYIGEKVVSFPQLFESLMKIDSKSLGYWGAESTKIDSQEVDGLPELIPAQLKSKIEKAASLQGAEKAKAFQDIRDLLLTQVQNRKRFAMRKVDSFYSKLETLLRLTNDMKNKDTVEVNKFLPKEWALEISQDDDPFK